MPHALCTYTVDEVGRGAREMVLVVYTGLGVVEESIILRVLHWPTL